MIDSKIFFIFANKFSAERFFKLSTVIALNLSVSIETEKFKAITVDDLKNLSAENLYEKIKNILESIN